MADFITQEIPFGAEGLDFQRTLDQVTARRFSISTNVIIDKAGRVTHRPGQLSFITGIADFPVHTLTRLENPTAGDSIFIGAGSRVSLGPATGGAATLIETGFSGSPLSVVVGHTALTGEPWAFVADTNKMRKVRAVDGLSLPLGLAKAGSLTAAADTTVFTTIDTFDNTGAWTNNAGTGGAPTNSYDAANFKQGTASLNLTSVAGAATAGYYNFWGKAYTLDLTTIGAALGTRPGGPPVPTPLPITDVNTPNPKPFAPSTGPKGITIQDVASPHRTTSDEDHFHFWIRTDRPDKILELRIYFVISASFSAAVVPGVGTTFNTDAYVKILRPDDFTPSIELSLGGTVQAQLANLVQQIIDQLPQVVDGRVSIADVVAQIERARAASQALAPGRGAWSEFGVVGRTLQRGQFRRIGSDTTRNWANVTGIVVVMQTVDNTSGINVWLDDFYLFGGSGPDSSQPGATKYDWRHINYDPRTGARSLPSTEFTDAQKIDLIRRSAKLTPAPYGDANVLQRFYRRGGALGKDWRFVGTNTSDGGVFTDDNSDLEAIAADTLNLDDDAPVTTSDRSGTTVYQQPLSSIFGPIHDILFGCGDPYHRGRLYWSKATEYEHWPSTNFVDVCPDGEELLVGFRLGGQGFVFSRERLYSIYPNLADSRIVSTQPTSCQKAPVERWCIAVGFGFCFFLERDGIYATNGGPETNITDDTLRPLFTGSDVGTPVLTRRPIDFSATADLRLFVVGDYLWFFYRDLSATRRVLRYNIVQKYWEGIFEFTTPCTAVYDDVVGQNVLLGGAGVGTVMTFTGSTDLGVAYSAQFFTGSLNQGIPRQKKQYADAYIDFSGPSASLIATPYVNNFATALAASTLAGTASRARNYLDFTDTVAYDLGLRVQWNVPTNQTPVYVYNGGVSFIPQPDEVEQRVTEWDAAGRLTDKIVKGIVLECDTFGNAKSLQLQADGATQATISLTAASGRRVVEFSFAQWKGRLLRIRPADEVKWILYSFSWIFDEEPLALLRWETQELALGEVGWKTPLYAHVALLSTADVTLQVIAYRQDGTSVTKTYTILSTAGAKVTRYVQFEAQKGVLYKLIFTSTTPFYLYREETILWVHNWTTGQDYEIKRAGTDDLDLVRASQNAALTAARVSSR